MWNCVTANTNSVTIKHERHSWCLIIRHGKRISFGNDGWNMCLTELRLTCYGCSMVLEWYGSTGINKYIVLRCEYGSRNFGFLECAHTDDVVSFRPEASYCSHIRISSEIQQLWSTNTPKFRSSASKSAIQTFWRLRAFDFLSTTLRNSDTHYVTYVCRCLRVFDLCWWGSYLVDAATKLRIMCAHTNCQAS